MLNLTHSVTVKPENLYSPKTPFCTPVMTVYLWTYGLHILSFCSIISGGQLEVRDQYFNPFDAHCCHMGTAINHPVPDRVKPSFVLTSFCQSAWMSKITNDGLIQHRMLLQLYTCDNSSRQRGKHLTFGASFSAPPPTLGANYRVHHCVAYVWSVVVVADWRICAVSRRRQRPLGGGPVAGETRCQPVGRPSRPRAVALLPSASRRAPAPRAGAALRRRTERQPGHDQARPRRHAAHAVLSHPDAA